MRSVVHVSCMCPNGGAQFLAMLLQFHKLSQIERKTILNHPFIRHASQKTTPLLRVHSIVQLTTKTILFAFTSSTYTVLCNKRENHESC